MLRPTLDFQARKQFNRSVELNENDPGGAT